MKKGLYVSTGVMAMTAGILFIAFSVSAKIFFGYPEMIRADPATLLGRLYEQRWIVPYAYYAGVGLGGLCVFFFSMLARKVFVSSGEDLWAYMGSCCGMVTGILLYTGIIRYTFLFPFLAEKRAQGANDMDTVDLIFQAFNIYVGNSVAEHVQFTFTSFMLIFFCIALLKTKLLNRWIAVLGFVTAAMILYGNGEFLLNLPGAFLFNRMGTAFWALWLIAFGTSLIRRVLCLPGHARH
jgi:hypothetical protein